MMPIGNSVDALSLEKCPHRLNIASWNLQVFGQSKANNQDSISEIAEKISQYDIVAVQELKDVQQTAPYMLQDELDNHETFGMVLSNRTGEFCESKNTGGISEQYAFYYNDATINSLDSGYHYPNNDCEFAREPFAARFKSAEYSHDFVLITLHVKPDDAVNEISALTNVFEWAKFQFPDEDDFILLGDLNADCDYASKSNLDELEIRNQNYEWIIPDGTKTKTAVSSSCTYDRIIFSDTGSEEYLDSYSTDCQSDLSDHCIISGLFSSHES
jgi:endonuclease/exonuclease/phosphatase family metal-dependent hydrolase